MFPKVVLSIGLIALATPFNSATALEIEGFKFGLVCADKLEISWICFETEKIYITGQGECDWGGETRICTWYGFEFYYRDAMPGDKIVCKSHSSKPTRSGNPEGVDTESLKTHEYSLELTRSEGRYFNPQYSIFTVVAVGAGPTIEETVCSYEGKKVFEFRQEIYFPEIDTE